MPLIRVEISAGRTVEQKQALAAAMTEAAQRILGHGDSHHDPDKIWVVIDEVADENMAIGGTLLALRERHPH